MPKTIRKGPVGTVTSVAVTVPTGLAVSGSPITASGTFAVTLAPGYMIPGGGVLGQVLTSQGASEPIWAATANPFDQDLNTDNAVAFAGITITGESVAARTIIDANGIFVAAKNTLIVNGAASVGDGTDLTGTQTQATTIEGNDKNYWALAGLDSSVVHEGSGILHYAFGLRSYLGNYNNGTIQAGYGFYAYAENYGTGTYDSIYQFVDGGDAYNEGTITNYYSFYAGELASIGAVNTYSFWHNAQGVYRIKEDNTFDGVYQAIPALYNPQFTRYVAGAADYERIVQQWNGNVAEIGAEKGGTGTLRAVKFIGASFSFAGVVTLASPVLTTPTLGVATATSINKVTITAPATSATLTIPDGVTLNAGAGGTLGSNAFTSTAYLPLAGGTMTGLLTLTQAVGASALSIAGGTQTASFPTWAVTQTWNNGAVVFTAADVNVTNTASSGNSRLLALRVASTDVFTVKRGGEMTTTGEIYSSSTVNAAPGGVRKASMDSGANWGTGFATINTGVVVWSSGTTAGASMDTTLSRQGAGVVQFGTTTANASGTALAATFIAASSSVTLDTNGVTMGDAKNIILNATTGTKIGTATNQKLAFYNATPIVQGASVADATGGATIDAEARTAINTLISRIEATGLIATV